MSDKINIPSDKLKALKETMKNYMVEYYKTEIAYVKQVKGLLDHVNEKQNLLDIKRMIDNKIK